MGTLVNYAWSHDFVEDRTHDGRKYRMLNVDDKLPHKCIKIRIARRFRAVDVIDELSDLFIMRGVLGHVRSDNTPEFIAKAVQEWIAPCGPWGDGYIEYFNGRLPPPVLRSAKMLLYLRSNGDDANFRCWLQADLQSSKIDFRSSPESRHSRGRY